jgi:DNA helicase-2/ATP-dependent DNA helicase PcrA
MTRAKEELYLCRARQREFRGSTNYTIPSQFLEELDGVGEPWLRHLDLSAGAAGTARAIDEWRSGSKAAEQGWIDAGVVLSPKTKKPAATDGSGPTYVEGMLVRHDSYGVGRVTEVSGFGALRKVKVRFSAAGERSFVESKAKLAIVQKP